MMRRMVPSVMEAPRLTTAHVTALSLQCPKAGEGSVGWGRTGADVEEALTTRTEDGPMSRYLRPRIPGASVFFTVALAERGSDVLVREIAALRAAVAATLRESRSSSTDGW
jgi:hypothetical protein